MHLEVLGGERLKLFYELSFLSKAGCYLAGGTALALQMGHRTSVDFDFYIKKHFQKNTLTDLFQDNLSDWPIKILRDFDDTFEVQAGKDIHLSCFYYRYPLLEKCINISGVNIAAIADIAAMKLVAISQRGKRRDFVDMYYLMKNFGLKKIIDWTSQKYPSFDIYSGLRGLLYFEDADNDAEVMRIKVFDKGVKWPLVKKYIKSETQKFQFGK
ncbi:hypothetical protein EPN15_04825 [Patescibacteria group bacterium]|nr:MAG: hypothetical protein EPN15_04825 [Patescibacteria group bacterium]